MTTGQREIEWRKYQVQFRDLLKRAVSEPGTISAAYSAFHDYSIGNQLAALFQCSSRSRGKDGLIWLYP
jgi:hypothetical protein